jgi:hypothetical protein
VTLPLPLRNRLADLVLQGFHDAAARAGLAAIAAVCASPAGLPAGDARSHACPPELVEQRDGALRIKSGWRQHAAEMAERAARARRALGERPLDPADVSLETALTQAAILFDARLYFEMHELLEPHWMRGQGDERLGLQGLIQVAVGLHHLSNGNAAGASALLHDGTAKLLGREVHGLRLDAFARALVRCLDEVNRLGAEATARFDWSRVPGFPGRPV